MDQRGPHCAVKRRHLERAPRREVVAIEVPVSPKSRLTLRKSAAVSPTVVQKILMI